MYKRRLLQANNFGGRRIATITAGPVWTDNTDGTATVTWTSSFATDSKVRYGATSSYGSTSTDASLVTSHSVVVTAAAATYHFSVGDIAVTYSSTDQQGAITAVPSTLNKTAAQIASAIFGYNDPTTNAGKIGWVASGTDGSWTTITAYMKGTDASMRLWSYSGAADKPMYVSVDDGNEVNPTMTNPGGDGVIVLFAGLSDTTHLVRIRSLESYSTSGTGYFTAGTVLSVTGVGPSITALGTAYHVTDPALPGKHLGATLATFGGNVVPTHRKSSSLIPAGIADFSFNKQVIINAKCTDLWIYCSDLAASYAIDTGSQVQTVFPSGLKNGSTGFPCWRHLASGLDGTAFHDYVISGGRTTNSHDGYPWHGVMIGGTTATYGTYVARNVIIQFGDSITQGANDATQYGGTQDIMVGAAKKGFAGLAVGKAGYTVGQLDTALTSIYDGTNRWPSGYAAILAIGYNDFANGTTQLAFKASYTSCVSKLLTAGFTKIVCRQVIPDPSGNMGSINTWISDVVNAVANANVTLLTVSGFTGIAVFAGGPHPTDAGYVTLEGYMEPTYTALV